MFRFLPCVYGKSGMDHGLGLPCCHPGQHAGHVTENMSLFVVSRYVTSDKLLGFVLIAVVLHSETGGVAKSHKMTILT